MSISCPEMAARAIEELRAKNLEPTLDQIASLIELARRVQEPEYRTFPWLSYHGIRAGNSCHVFRPLTIKSGMWFDFISDHLHSDDLNRLATAYAMEHGNDESVDFLPLYNPVVATQRLTEYGARLSCNIDELEDALMRCMDEITEGDRLNAKNSTGSEAVDKENTIAQLVAITGLDESYWLSKTTDFACKVLTHAMKTNAGPFGDSSGGVDLNYQKANFDFIAEVAKIERKLLESVNSGG